MILKSLRSFFWESIRTATEDGAMQAVKQQLKERVPDLLNDVCKEKFAANPNMLLTNAGFGFAMGLELNALWPEIDIQTASKWLWEYVGYDGGLASENWTPATAKAIAAEYAREYGEQHP